MRPLITAISLGLPANFPHGLLHHGLLRQTLLLCSHLSHPRVTLIVGCVTPRPSVCSLRNLHESVPPLLKGRSKASWGWEPATVSFLPPTPPPAMSCETGCLSLRECKFILHFQCHMLASSARSSFQNKY